MPESTLTTLFDPIRMPALGMNTSVHPMGLRDGQWAAIDNLRIGDGTLKYRGGMTASLGTVLAASTFRGMWTGQLGGTYHTVVAVDDGAATKLMASSDLATWAEITVASGQYGSTRFTTGDYACRFETFSDPMYVATGVLEDTAPSYLAVCNGRDEVRLFYFASGFWASLGKVQPTVARETVGQLDVQVRTVETTWDLQAANTYTEMEAEMGFAVNGASPNRQARMQIFAAVDTGDNCSLQFTTSKTITATFSGDKQLLVGIDTSYINLWDKVKVEFGPNASLITIWDPSAPNTYSRPIPVALDGTNKTIWAFRIPARTSTWASVDTIKFTFAAGSGSPSSEAPSATQTIDIFLVGLTYAVPWTADYKMGMTYGMGHGFTKALTESGGIIYQNYTAQRIKDLGGPVLNELRLPLSPLLKAVFYAPYTNTSTAQRDLGVDYVNFYVKKTGSSQYYFCMSKVIAAYNVGLVQWEYSAGSAEADLTYVLAGPDNTTTKIYPPQYLPDAYNAPIPKATELRMIGGRLLVGTKTSTQAQLAVSQYGNPFRFRALSDMIAGQYSANGPLVIPLGSETITAIVPVAGSTLGGSVTYLITDQNIYTVGGTEAFQLATIGRVANLGSVSPYSWSADKGVLFGLDTEMQVQMIAGGRMASISRDVIDDTFAAIPGSQRKWVYGCFSNDLYYMAYAPVGATTNTKIGVYDARAGAWVTDTPPKAVSGLVRFYDGTAKTMKLVAIGVDAGSHKAYQYDLSTQSQDLGTTNITATLTTREFHAEDGKGLMFNRVGITMDDIASAVGTITRTYKPHGGTRVSTISLDTTENQIVRYDDTPPPSAGEGSGVTGQLSLSLPGTAGKRIYKIITEIEDRSHAYDTSS